MTDGFAYCGETVRKHDPDRFLLSHFAPASCRPYLWALFAFNHEVAKTREVVTDTNLGLIRLQWWREAVGMIYDGKKPHEHQVVEPLAQAIHTYQLPREPFDSLIYAREFDVEDRLPASLEGMMNYADYTATPLLSLALQVAGEAAGQEDIRKVATAYALCGILRATPFHLSQRRCYLPQDMIPPVSELYEGQRTSDLAHAAQKTVTAAKDLLVGVQPRQPLLRRHAKLARMHLSAIAGNGYDLFRPAHVPFREIRLLLG